VLLDKQTAKDELTSVTNESIYTYDGTVTSANYFGLQTKSISNTYSGSTLQGTSTVDNTYDSNPSGTGNLYYIGRPKTVNSSKTAYNDTRTASEEYTYTGFNLTQTEKNGHNTVSIFEDMTYDALGNLLTKKVSVPVPTVGAPVVQPRTIQDIYDSTKRFVIQKIDHQGFISNLEYDNLGQVTKSTNPLLGLISEFTFDSWGKLTQTKTTGASTTPLVSTIGYTKLPDGGYTTTSTNTVGDNAVSITQYDVLGRVVKNTTKGFAANSFIAKQIVYDALGHKLKESEPFFSTVSPSKWTSYEYDYLHRPTKVTMPTGRIQTLVYLGLTTTSNDDTKVTSATQDALGNKTQTTDEGGTIAFSYFANGQLKETDYGGHKITIGIDGWGNKISMLDPNAGAVPYTYSFDDFGQSYKETTPKGVTTFEYDNFGKLTKKTILGDGADFVTQYAYNSFAQLISETSKTAANVLIDTFTYNIDATSHKLTSVVETNPKFSQTKTLAYDSFGRVITETNNTTDTASGLSQTTVEKSNYNTYNGIMDKLTDSNNAVLWQLNTTNEKMQALTATLGNGVAVTNVYDDNNYFLSQKHTKGTTNILYNTYDFNGVKGNLNSRQNVPLGILERFTYDNLDRLTQWESTGKKLWDCSFSVGLEGFTANPSVGVGVGGSLVNYNGQLKVTAFGANRGVQKKIVEKFVGYELDENGNSVPITISYVGKKIKIKTNFTKVSGNTNVRLTIVEKDPVTLQEHLQDMPTLATGVFETEYFVSTYPDVYLRFYLEDLPPSGLKMIDVPNGVAGTPTPTAVFYIDNLQVNDIDAGVQSYDTRGRIDQNNLGTYNYTNSVANGIYRKTSISLTPAASTYYQDKSLQSVTYTMFKSPININVNAQGSTLFTYNSHLSRMTMDYGYNTNTSSYTKTKSYTDDGSTEILKTPTTITIRTYIGGNAYTAPLYIDKTKTIATGVITEKKYYLHRDYLGSILAISDENGIAVERRLFDAWGNLSKLEQNGALVNATTSNGLEEKMMMDRGYTSHEHLAEVGLIQMNGRLYDPKLRTFLMPDNFIQQPENTQNYNRYAYVLNNPLKYTDPSGEYAEIGLGAAVLIGIAIAACTYTLTALLSDVPFTVGGLCKAAFIGAVSATVTFGIGSAATSVSTNFFVKAGFQAVLHGAFQGAMTEATGGKFWSGFAAGALSSIAASAWSGGGSTSNYHGAGSFADNGAGMIAFGTVAGGAGASLTGGNFWQGAVTGLVVSGLNHFAHQIKIHSNAKEWLKNGGYDSNEDISGMDESARDSYVKGMRENVYPADILYDDAGNPNIGYDSAISDYGSYNNKEVTIYSKAFSTNKDLFLTIMHEGMHAWDDYHGLTSAWGSKSRAITETRAYEMMRYFDNNVFNNGDHSHYYDLYSNMANKSGFNNFRIKSYSMFFNNIQR
jgi:RHS repeat-associated protein